MSHCKTAVRSQRTLFLLASTACALALPAMAMAQQQAPGSDDEGTAVEEVIVTTQRREERLQDVPAAVSAFNEGQLERLGIDGSKELSQITPGLNFTQSVFSPQPTIRGIGVRGVGAGDESVVPIYIDGVYQSFIAASDMQFNNIARIEVVKGPQGALLGRNATGGAINVITKTPGEGFEGKASVSYGSFNEVVTKVYISGGTDVIAADLALFGLRDDGYIDDPLRDDTYGRSTNYSIRSKVVYTPNDFAQFRVSLGYTNNVESTGEAYRQPNGNTQGARVPGNPVTTEAYKSRLSYEPYNKLRIANASFTGIFQFDAFTLTSVTGVANNKLRIKADSDGTPLEIATLTYVQVSANQYQEVYATSNGDGPFSWIVGGVYFHDVSGMSPYSTTYSRSVSLAGVLGPQAVSRTRPRIETNAIAIYAQGTMAFGDQWKVTLGGRYSTENKDYASRVGVGPTFTYLQGSKTFEDFSPTLIVQYEPTDRYNIYFKAGKAFKSGVFNASASNAAAAVPVDPEEVTQYELGLKSDPASWLRLNVAAYYTDYKGLQSNVRDPVTLSSLLQNAGGAKIYGIETEAFIRPVDNLNIRLGLSWLHGEYEDFGASLVSIPQTTTNPPAAMTCTLGTGAQVGGNRSAFCDVTGNDIIRTPFLTGNIGADYTIQTGAGEIVLTGNAYYKGKSYWDTLNYFEEPAVWTFNADITWNLPGDKFAISLWGENLSDEEYSLTKVISSSGENQVLAKPRTFGVELSYRW